MNIEYLNSHNTNFLKELKQLDYRTKPGKEILKLSSQTNKKNLFTEIDKIIKKRILNQRKIDKSNLENQLLTLDNFTKIERTDIQDIIFTLDHYKLCTRGNKNILYKRLYKFLSFLNLSKSHLHSLIKLQRFFIKKIYYKNYIEYGPAYLNYELSTNLNDFYTFDHIKNIDKKYFFSYKDSDNFIYSFDIRSIDKLFKQNSYTNPYNRKKFSDNVIQLLNNRIENMVLNKNIIQNSKSKPRHYLIKRKVTDVFQKMDELDQYTDVKWFNNLDIKQLKNYYRSLEDIWNYRAQLTQIKKNQIVNEGNICSTPINAVFRMKNLYDVQDLILNEIDRLITEGVTKDEKILGCMYVLTSFAEISTDAASSLPWLVQI